MTSNESLPDRSKYGKRHKPTADTRKMVTELSALGLRNEDICAMIKTSIPTLLKHYEKEIREGRIKANAKIAQTLYKKAIDGDTACLIFWAKTRLGWKEDPTTAIQINNQTPTVVIDTHDDD